MSLYNEDSIGELKLRIEHKFNSLNYQPGFTLPRAHAPWYVIITELRLFLLSPLVIISKMGKPPIYNITKDEFKIILRYFEHLYPCPLYNDDGDVMKENNTNITIKRTDEHVWKLDYDRFWGDCAPVKLEPPWGDNSNLDRIDRAVILCYPEKEWYVWIFGNKQPYPLGILEEIEYYLPPNLSDNEFDNTIINGLYDMLKHMLERSEVLDSLKSSLLFSIDSKFERDLERRIPEVIIQKLEDINILLSQQDAHVQRKKQKWIIRDNNGIKCFISKGDNKLNVCECPVEEKLLFPIWKYKEHHSKTLGILDKEMSNKQMSANLDIKPFIEDVKNTPYFKVLMDFFDRIYKRITQVLEEKNSDIEFDILFNTLGGDPTEKKLVRTLIIPLAWYNRLLNRKTSVNILTFNEFYNFWGEYHYKLGESKGLGGYIDKTNYPEFLIYHPQIEKKDRRLAMEFKEYERWLKLFGLKTDRIFYNIQIPCVFTWHEDETGNIIIISLYNFSNNLVFKTQEPNVNLLTLREVYRETFDLAFDLLFAASFVQKEQEELFRASLVEEAAKTFKKALEFPLNYP